MVGNWLIEDSATVKSVTYLDAICFCALMQMVCSIW